MLGINHYLTSERFLDHRLHLYPGLEPGGNGRDPYVDAEAVRVKRLERRYRPRRRGCARRGSATASRSRSPRSITAARRDEQLRWFAEVWETARRAARRGHGPARGHALVAVRQCRLALAADPSGTASTTPARSTCAAPEPRPTVVAKAAAAYAARRGVRSSGARRARLVAPAARGSIPGTASCKPLDGGGRKLLITGATGTLGRPSPGSASIAACPSASPAAPSSTSAMPRRSRAAIARHRPWAVDQHRRLRPRRRRRARARRLLRLAMPRAPRTSREPAPRPAFRWSPSRPTWCSTASSAGPIVESDPVSPASVYGAQQGRGRAARARRRPSRRWSSAPAPSSARGTATISPGTC